jgi:crotonobetainyl-CoA:carnitine CoA-transferase CaiB-like acyl-CoA transferase
LIACGAVNTVADLVQYPQLRRLAAARPSGPVEMVVAPTRFAGEAPHVRPVPALDEHGASLRAKFAA